MAIRSVSKDSVKYVPVYSGNREDKDPLWVMLHPLNRLEFDKYTKKTKYFQKQGSKGEWDSNIVDIQKKQFVDNISEVHGFLDADTNEPITSIERLYEEAPHTLVDEILQAILDISQMGDNEVKN